MSRIACRNLALGATALVLGACGDTTAPPPTRPGMLSIEFQNTIGDDVYGNGAYLGEAVWLEGTTLRAVLSSPCSNDAISVVAPQRFTPSRPPTLDLYLQVRHAGADSCYLRAVDTVAVDLGPAIRLHDSEYPAEDPWWIRLAARTPGPLPVHTLAFVRLPPRPAPPGSGNRDLEAQDLALWLADSLATPDDLYETLLREMASIRSQFRDRFPELRELRFIPPHDANSLYLVLDPSTADAMLKDQYRAWDILNESLGILRVDSYAFDSHFFVLHFQSRVHPRESTARYFELPGVLCANPNSFFSWLHWYVYPQTVGGGRSYLFQGGKGDCPAGCAIVHYIYFEPQAGGIALAGDWTTGYGHSDPRPGWWPEAQRNIDLYDGWRNCCHLGYCGLDLGAAWRD